MKLFDLHCDTITECWRRGLSLQENRELHISLARGLRYTPWFQCFAIWIPDELRGQAAVDFFMGAASYVQRAAAVCGKNITVCRKKEDFNEKDNCCNALLTVEGGAVLAGDLANVALLERAGVKALTLTWNGGNEIGDGAMAPAPKGLTAFGRQVIPALEQSGIVVDVSHASDPLFYDVAALAQKPIIATHSNARAVCGHPRNLTDAQFQIIRERGGLVGLNLHRWFLREDGAAAFDDVFRHVYHFLSLGGETTLALGTDFDGAEVLAPVGGIEGLEALGEYFYKRGLGSVLIDRIFYQNAKEFFDSL